jgi:hypothetical protein
MRGSNQGSWPVPRVRIPCDGLTPGQPGVTRKQARAEGTLDAQVFSLQARRALFATLDLVPPGLPLGPSPVAAGTDGLNPPSAPDRPSQQPKVSGRWRHLPPEHVRRSSGTSCSARDPVGAAGSAENVRVPAGAGHAAAWMKRASSAVRSEGGSLQSYEGATWLSRDNVHRFVIGVLGTRLVLGTYKPEHADSGARLYDALQLLLHGPCANTTFPWRTYTQADVAAAAKVLESKGVDVHQAVVYAGEGLHAGQWTGVARLANGTSWRAQLFVNTKGSPKLNIRWGAQQSAEGAARQADCGLLAIQGLRCTTNFPASAYHQPQLAAAGEHAISKGVEAARVKRNLAAVEQVCQSSSAAGVLIRSKCSVAHTVACCCSLCCLYGTVVANGPLSGVTCGVYLGR